jgi:hypothetical protein
MLFAGRRKNDLVEMRFKKGDGPNCAIFLRRKLADIATKRDGSWSDAKTAF